MVGFGVGRYTPMTFSSQGSHLIAPMFGLPNKRIDFIERR